MTDWVKPSELFARPMARMAVLADSAENSENPEIPDNHVITVRERAISIDVPTMIQNNVATDTVTLDLDGEWDGLSVVLLLDKTQLEWKGEPLTVPSALTVDVGGIDVSVVGRDLDGVMRLVTKDAPSAFNVVKSGRYIGDTPTDDVQDLMGQLLAAAEAAESATDDANTAATAANLAAEAANDAAEAALQASERNKIFFAYEDVGGVMMLSLYEKEEEE